MPYYTYGSRANFLFLESTALLYISKERCCNEGLRGVGKFKIERVIASEASLLHELAGAFLWYIYIFVSMGSPFGPAWAPVNTQRANVGPAG